MPTTPKRTPHRMFQVVVLAGVSMGAACGSGTSPSPYPDGGPVTNPPAPMDAAAGADGSGDADAAAGADGSGDAGIDAPSDGRGDEMPIIK